MFNLSYQLIVPLSHFRLFEHIKTTDGHDEACNVPFNYQISHRIIFHLTTELVTRKFVWHHYNFNPGKGFLD